MAFRGRYQLGQEIPLGTITRDAAGTPALPAASPLMNIFSATGAKVLSKEIPIFDRYGTTAFFQLNVFLDAVFSAGLYRVVYLYTISGFNGIDEDGFEIVPGGNSQGSVIAMADFIRPHARFIVTQLDSGRIQKNRNPSV